MANRTAIVAWLVLAVYYFYQYALRSAPAVMMPQLSDAFGISTMGVASMVGALLLRLFTLQLGGRRGDGPAGTKKGGPRRCGSGWHRGALVRLRRQPGCKYRPVPPGRRRCICPRGCGLRRYQKLPCLPRGDSDRRDTDVWHGGWIGGPVRSRTDDRRGPAAGVLSGWQRESLVWQSASFSSSFCRRRNRSGRRDDWLRAAAAAFGTVFRNPQSILCGLIAGLLFLPTTIFDMIWGVRFLQEARGFDYAAAVIRSATVPLGWVIGCPLLGFVSDRIGRRKPVIMAAAVVLLACLAWILYGRADVLPPYVLGLVAGLASGAAMLPYIVIKEANPPEVSGTATGVVNFLNFTASALLAPVVGWIMRRVAGEAQMTLVHYQTVFSPLLFGVGLAIVLTFLLKETGPAVRSPAVAAVAVKEMR